jgi:hypothetical protein
MEDFRAAFAVTPDMIWNLDITTNTAMWMVQNDGGDGSAE